MFGTYCFTAISNLFLIEEHIIYLFYLTFYLFRLANLGRFEKAVEDFQKALKYNPTHSNARKYICETLVELGKQ